MKEVDRRTFLKLGTAVVVGVTSGITDKILSGAADQATTTVTGLKTGNAGMEELVNQTCKREKNRLDCEKKFYVQQHNFYTVVYLSPITEELIFRAVPSALISNTCGEVIVGTGKFSLSRREIIAGVISTVLFGAAHNLTISGFNTNTIPASQTVGGAIYWYFQRVFGVGSNTLAHIISNYRYIAESV